jgi:hypothetical protein
MTVLLAGVGALAALAGCGKVMAGREQAERHVSEFHAMFNEGRFDAIYDAASDELRESSRREDLTALLAAVQRKIGKVTGSTNQTWNVRTQNLRTYVVLTQDTAFDSGRATETFQYVIRDDRAVLLGYNISSRELIVR